MKIRHLFISLFLLSQSLYAQESMQSEHPEATNCDDKGYCWGDKREEGKEKFAMYSDNYNFGEYAWKDAEPPLDWLINNIPYLTYTMYVNGYKIYDHLQEEAEGDKKAEYQDKLLNLLDKRIIYFGNEAEILQRKGTKSYSYLMKRDKKDYDALFELYDRIFKLNGADTYRGNMIYLIVMAKVQYSRKKLDANGFMEYLDNVGEAIEKNKENANEAEVKKWEEIEEKIDDLIPQELLNCELITERMGPKLEAEPDNLDHAKKVMKFLVKGKCYDTPIFLETAKAVFKGESSVSMASIIAKKYISSQEYAEALTWLEKGIEVAEEEPQKRSEFYLNKAQVLSTLGRLSEAREAAKESAEISKDNQVQAYTLIGDMYMSSGNRCEDNNPIKYRAIYLAAYDAYAMAGAQTKMNSAKEQFPSIEEIFTAGYKEGDEIEVGCWIGGTTELRRRP